MTLRLTYRLQGTEVILCKTDEEEQQAWGDKINFEDEERTS